MSYTQDSDNVCLPEHCFYAFDTLYCALTREDPIEPQFPDDKYPLFVTWNTRSSRPGRPPHLRGCIGNFEPMSLHTGIAEYALISAFKDSRFRPIERGELKSLECGISLLTDFEPASSYLDWEIGEHGIYISFHHPSLLPSSSEAPSPLTSNRSTPSVNTTRSTRSSHTRHYTATYLPDVIPEQGWSKVEAVDSAIQKAGWRGAISEDLRRSVKLRRYQSRKSLVGWEEYWAWREKQLGGPQ